MAPGYHWSMLPVGRDEPQGAREPRRPLERVSARCLTAVCGWMGFAQWILGAVEPWAGTVPATGAAATPAEERSLCLLASDSATGADGRCPPRRGRQRHGHGPWPHEYGPTRTGHGPTLPRLVAPPPCHDERRHGCEPPPGPRGPPHYRPGPGPPNHGRSPRMRDPRPRRRRTPRRPPGPGDHWPGPEREQPHPADRPPRPGSSHVAAHGEPLRPASSCGRPSSRRPHPLRRLPGPDGPRWHGADPPPDHAHRPPADAPATDLPPTADPPPHPAHQRRSCRPRWSLRSTPHVLPEHPMPFDFTSAGGTANRPTSQAPELDRPTAGQGRGSDRAQNASMAQSNHEIPDQQKRLPGLSWFLVDRRSKPNSAASALTSVETETATSGGVEVLDLEAVAPVALVVLLGEVGGAGAGEQGGGDAGGVALVAGAPRGGRDVHDVAPALLVLDRSDAVDHVSVPPDGVAGLDVGDPGQRLQKQRVPLLVGREDLVGGDAAHVVGDVGQKRPQHQVGHRVRDRD